MLRLIEGRGRGMTVLNFGVGTRAHKKVNGGKQSTPVPEVRKKVKLELKSNLNVTKKYWRHMIAKCLIVLNKLGT
jgi:hypothetical protein